MKKALFIIPVAGLLIIILSIIAMVASPFLLVLTAEPRDIPAEASEQFSCDNNGRTIQLDEQTYYIWYETTTGVDDDPGTVTVSDQYGSTEVILGTGSTFDETKNGRTFARYGYITIENAGNYEFETTNNCTLYLTGASDLSTGQWASMCTCCCGNGGCLFGIVVLLVGIIAVIIGLIVGRKKKPKPAPPVGPAPQADMYSRQSYYHGNPYEQPQQQSQRDGDWWIDEGEQGQAAPPKRPPPPPGYPPKEAGGLDAPKEEYPKGEYL